MLAVRTSVETSRGGPPQISQQPDAYAPDRDSSLPAELLARESAEDSDDYPELMELRYQQHVAQRELQDLFENGHLQSLEG